MKAAKAFAPASIRDNSRHVTILDLWDEPKSVSARRTGIHTNLLHIAAHSCAKYPRVGIIKPQSCHELLFANVLDLGGWQAKAVTFKFNGHSSSDSSAWMLSSCQLTETPSIT